MCRWRFRPSGPERAFRWSSTRRRTGSCRNRSPTCCGIPARCGSRSDRLPATGGAAADRQSRWRRAGRHSRANIAAMQAGFGIAGMRERAELLGGTLRAGPAAGGGFEVTAVLAVPGVGPVRRADRRTACLPVGAGAAADPIASARRAIVISVVIVDDQHLVRAGVRALLERAPRHRGGRRGGGRRIGVARRRAVPAGRGADGRPDARPGRCHRDPPDHRRSEAVRRRRGGADHVRRRRARLRGHPVGRSWIPAQGHRARRSAPRGAGGGGRRVAALADGDRPGDAGRRARARRPGIAPSCWFR